MSRIRHYTLLLSLVVGLSACAQERSGGGSSLTTARSYPDELKKAYTTAQGAENIRSLLVSHHGELVAEEYFQRYSSDSLDHVRSVTKSVMSTLIGIAIEKGHIKDLDEPAYHYLGDYTRTLSEDKKQITIRHLLSMTSGFQWTESAGNSEYNEWVTSGDPVSYVLDKPMAHQPGAHWEYNTGGFHLLSVVLNNATGTTTLSFAQKHLFEPLGIDKVRWETLRAGYHNGGAGLELNPRDMIRFGLLYKDQGLFNNERIVSAAYIKEATSPHYPANSIFRGEQGYGLGWWLGKSQGVSGFMAQGYAGQMIAVAPEIELVIVMTHNWRLRGKKVLGQGTMAFSTLTEQVLEGALKMEK